MTSDASTTLLVVPARGGSKRLARKNLLEIAGQPMICHTISAALESQLAPEVYVCTEDDEIAYTASKAGARVFRIPPEMAEDDVSSTTPVLVLLEELMDSGRYTGESLVFNLQPTSPLRNADDIVACARALTDSNAEFALSVTEIDPHYFHWALVDNDQGWGMFFGKKYLKERIELPPVMRPNGAIKLARAGALMKTGHYFGSPTTVYEMPDERSIHVGTEFDLLCARAIAQSRVS